MRASGRMAGVPGRGAGVAAVLAALLVAGPSWGQESGTVSGTVSDELGNPLANITLTLFPDGPSTTTDSDGRFNFTAPVGDYLLRYEWNNRTWEWPVEVKAGQDTATNLTARSGSGGAIDPFPFLYLAAAMAAVVVGGFYVNKRMSETGLDFDKTVVGGAPARKPFRRRRRPKSPRPPT